MIDYISTIPELIQQLNNAPSDKFSSILKKIDIPASDFDSYATWCKEDYTRNCIARTPDYEMILLCWDQNIKTAIHDHGGQDCWVYQVKGKIEETLYKKLDQKGLENPIKQTIKEGELTYMNDEMGFHALENISDHRSLTLHIYNAPIEACKIFDEEEERLNEVEMSYDTYKGKKVM